MRLRSPRVRPPSGIGGDDEVEESIEYVEDDEQHNSVGHLSANIHPSMQVTRHTRSHFELHSKKPSAAAHSGSSRPAVELRRGQPQPRVPLQPRVSTPPCASTAASHQLPSSGGKASGGNSWGSGGGQRSCSCLSPSGTYASAQPAASRKPRQPTGLAGPSGHREAHNLRVSGVSPSARTFWQLPSSPVRALRGSADSSIGTPPSPDAMLIPGSPNLGLGDTGMVDGGAPGVGNSGWLGDDLVSGALDRRPGTEEESRAYAPEPAAAAAPSALSGPWHLPPDFGAHMSRVADMDVASGRGSRAGGVSRGRMSAVSANDEIEEVCSAPCSPAVSGRPRPRAHSPHVARASFPSL